MICAPYYVYDDQIYCHHIKRGTLYCQNSHFYEKRLYSVGKYFICKKCIIPVKQNYSFYSINEINKSIFEVKSTGQEYYENNICIFCQTQMSFRLHRYILLGNRFTDPICRICFMKNYSRRTCYQCNPNAGSLYREKCDSCFKKQVIEIYLCAFHLDYNRDTTNIINKYLTKIKKLNLDIKVSFI